MKYGKIIIILVMLLLVPFYSLNNLPDAAAVTSGKEGASVKIKVASLNPSTTYTVCFSTANYYCSIGSSVPNTVYTFTGSTLTTGTTLTVPAIAGGQYYIVIVNPSSTAVAAAAFAITGSAIGLPNNSAGVGSTQKINATNLASATTYTVCFATAPTTGCSSGPSATGSTLGGAGVSVVVPDLVPGLYYVNIESAVSPPSTLQIVATSTLTVTSPITLSATNGKEGASITIKDASLNPSTTYTVCFSTANYYCSIPSSVPNVSYTFTGSALVTAKTLTVPAVVGGQYYVVILNPSSTLVSAASFSITPSAITFPTSTGVGSTQTIKATNLASATTYTVCFATAPATGCSSGTSATGSTLGGAGVSVIVPDLAPGRYYVNIESALSPSSALQIAATSSVTITTPIALGATNGLEGASVSIKVASLNPSTTYTICFSTAYYYCSIPSSVPNVSYTLTGTQLSTGQTLHVPMIAGGQYYVVILNPSSTLVSAASFSITPSVMTFPDSGSPTTAKKITVTNLVSTTTYTICFETAPTTGCSSGISATGSALAAGTNITPGASVTTGKLWYVNVESALSPSSSLQIVATYSFTSTPSTTSVLALGGHGGLEGSSVKANATNLVSATTYTVCFSTAYYYCSISNTVPNAVYTFTGSNLATSKTLTVPAVVGGQYFVVVLDPSSTVVSTASFSTTTSSITFTNSTGVGSTKTLKATNLISASTYTICFATAPATGCSSGTSATGSTLGGAGVSVTVPDLTSGLYYVNIESALSPPSTQQIVATSTVIVTSPITLNATSGLEGANVSIKDASLSPSITYTVCYSIGYYYCSISNTVPNAVYTFTGSTLATAQKIPVPAVVGGQYYIVILNPSSTVISAASFSITPSSITFPNSVGVGSTQSITANNLIKTATYTICFATAPTTGCSTGISATGSALAAGVSIIVPDLTPGLYYVNIESAVSPSTQQIVATSTSTITTPITLT